MVAAGCRPTLLGVALGVLGALAATRLLQGLLYGVGSGDPITFLVVAVLLLAVAVFASLWPAWRASRVDPIAALRDR